MLNQERLRRLIDDANIYHAEGSNDGAFFFFQWVPEVGSRVVIEMFVGQNGTLHVLAVIGPVGSTPAERTAVLTLASDLCARYTAVKFIAICDRLNVSIELLPPIADLITSSQIGPLIAYVSEAWYVSENQFRERLGEARRLEELESAFRGSAAAIGDDEIEF